jgi:hypothetical protein
VDISNDNMTPSIGINTAQEGSAISGPLHITDNHISSEVLNPSSILFSSSHFTLNNVDKNNISLISIPSSKVRADAVPFEVSSEVRAGIVPSDTPSSSIITQISEANNLLLVDNERNSTSDNLFNCNYKTNIK